MAKNEKDIYALKLHESIYLVNDNYECYEVMRVHGGWIYDRVKYTNEGNGVSATSVFVPCSVWRLGNGEE